jgi:hypothetical protein
MCKNNPPHSKRQTTRGNTATRQHGNTATRQQYREKRCVKTTPHTQRDKQHAATRQHGNTATTIPHSSHTAHITQPAEHYLGYLQGMKRRPRTQSDVTAEDLDNAQLHYYGHYCTVTDSQHYTLITPVSYSCKHSQHLY